MDRLSARSRALLLAGLLPVFTALIAYSVTWAFVWDEGFHLVAAELIAAGKRPYIDFCFPQTPLNAYINSLILTLFGDRWQPVHLLAAAYLCVTTWLVADFIATRLPSPQARVTWALAAALLFALDPMVVQFGPTGQSYAIGMLLGVAAFRAALPASSSKSFGFALLAGIFAGGAAASTLLTSPVAMVLLVWFLCFNLAGNRSVKTAAFLLGCALPFTPVIWLYIQAPRQTWFNVLQYQTFFRRTNWGDANLHDLDVMTDWLNSPQALLLMVLSAAALVLLFRLQNAEVRAIRRDFLLAASLGFSLVIFISTAHPTFERYYCLAVPYLCMLSVLGLQRLGEKLLNGRRAWMAAAFMVALSSCMFLRSLFDQREDEHWPDYYDVATRVSELTPVGAIVYVDEPIYFLLHQTPPEGLSFSYAEKLELSREQEKLFHIISEKEIRQQLAAGQVAVFETCRESVMDGVEPAPYFRNHAEPNECDLFSGPKAKPSAEKR